MQISMRLKQRLDALVARGAGGFIAGLKVKPAQSLEPRFGMALWSIDPALSSGQPRRRSARAMFTRRRNA